MVGLITKQWYDQLMLRTVWKNRCLFVVLLTSLFLVTACLPASTSIAVPTLAAVANLPVEESAVNGMASNVIIPGTYTPEPQVTLDTRQNFADTSPLAVTAVAGSQPFIPTNTPRPVWQPPTRTPLPTPTLTPSPTPIVPYEPYAGSGPRIFFTGYPPVTQGSKLSIHVIRSNETIMDFVRRTHPAVLKSVDDLGFMTEVKKISPNTITVGRVYEANQQFAGNPEESARDYVDRQLKKYLLNPGVDYWEGWNEPNPQMDNIGWYTRFEQERVRQLAKHGLRAAIGGFATGTPEMDVFAQFVPAIETAMQYGGILTLHEYGAPVLTYLYGSALPGYPAYPDRGALTFRYRWYYREILEPAGLVIPLIITEAGIDGILGSGRPGPNGFGWADFQDYAVDQGWGKDGTEAFINQLAWYDAGVRQDDYVYGFTVFTAGPVGHWRKYNIDSILPDLAHYVTSHR